MISQNQINAARMRGQDFLAMADRHRFVAEARRSTTRPKTPPCSPGFVRSFARYAVTALATIGFVARTN
jgi:hypothetical protein